MKKITLIIFSIFLINCSNSKDNEPETPAILPGFTNYTYVQALNKLGLELNTFYNYKGVYVNDPIGKIKFNTDQTITEIYNNTTATYGYVFSSNNQNDMNQLSLHFAVSDNSIIPSYNPKMPVTSLAKHFGFDVHIAENYGVKRVHIGGLYSYADPTNYEKIILLQ